MPFAAAPACDSVPLEHRVARAVSVRSFEPGRTIGSASSAAGLRYDSPADDREDAVRAEDALPAIDGSLQPLAGHREPLAFGRPQPTLHKPLTRRRRTGAFDR